MLVKLTELLQQYQKASLFYRWKKHATNRLFRTQLNFRGHRENGLFLRTFQYPENKFGTPSIVPVLIVQYNPLIVITFCIKRMMTVAVNGILNM